MRPQKKDLAWPAAVLRRAKLGMPHQKQEEDSKGQLEAAGWQGKQKSGWSAGGRVSGAQGIQNSRDGGGRTEGQKMATKADA